MHCLVVCGTAEPDDNANLSMVLRYLLSDIQPHQRTTGGLQREIPYSRPSSLVAAFKRWLKAAYPLFSFSIPSSLCTHRSSKTSLSQSFNIHWAHQSCLLFSLFSFPNNSKQSSDQSWRLRSLRWNWSLSTWPRRRTIRSPSTWGQFQTRSRAQKINALVECKKDRRYRPSHHVNTRKISQMVA